MKHHFNCILLLFIFTIVLFGCSADEEYKNQSPIDNNIVNFIETGDLTALKKRGTIRLLRLNWEADTNNLTGLPRQGLPPSDYQRHIEAFVEQLGLAPQWIDVNNFAALSSSLLEGQGDIIVSNFTQTPKRERNLAFSLPISQSQEFIISQEGSELDTIDSLNGLRIAIRAGSSFQTSLLDLLDEHPKINFDLVILSGRDDPDYILDRLNNGDFDATVMDSNLLKNLQTYREDFRVGTAINELRNIAWAVRPSNTDLLDKLNLYLLESLSKQDWDKRYLDDWDKILERKTLRVITRNNPASYFLWRGELMGFDYELMRHFAKKHKLKLEMVVAPPNASLFTWLREGRGDIIASSITVSDARRALGATFSHPYNHVAEQFVTAIDKAPIKSLDDLKGRTISLHAKSHYWQTAKKLQAAGHQFHLKKIEEGLTTAEVLVAVADGKYDATIADSHIVSIEKRFVDNLAPGLMLTPKLDHAWAVRPDNRELLKQLNQYLDKEIGSKHFNVVKQKYFSDKKKIDKYQGNRLSRDSQLSPFDQFVKTSASEHQLDWRLITAQMYQESQFNPNARSHVGAHGLMQVMPRTARELGYKLPFSEQSGIEAGVTYLAWSRDRFESTLAPQERIWFSLAAYNAGAGHVYDARRLAEQQGLNPDIWFDNVERAMLLLSKRKYHRKSRFGYVRGSEPVNYVRNIQKRYIAYLDFK